MPSRRLLALTLAALWAASAPLRAAVPAPGAVLERCAAHKPALAGWPALHAQCPGLGRALKQIGVRELLPRHWRQTLRSDGLGGLVALARHYAAAPRSSLPNPAVLRDTARALATPPPAPSEWERIRTWLSRWTAPLTKSLRDSLHALLRGHGRSGLVHTLLWFLVALLGAFALTGVYFGARAGWFKRNGRRTKRPQRAPLPQDTSEPPRRPDWSALGNQPSRILRILVEALVTAGRLDREQHLTCQELAAQAQFDTSAQREEFSQLARLAERERYGPPGVARLPEAILHGVPALYAQCIAASTRGTRPSP